jgi:hypothetical protein
MTPADEERMLQLLQVATPLLAGLLANPAVVKHDPERLGGVLDYAGSDCHDLAKEAVTLAKALMGAVGETR